MKFVLTSQDEDYSLTNTYTTVQQTMRTVSFASEYLHDIVAEFELFLRGSGFVFDKIEVFDGGDETQEYGEDTSGDLFKDESKDEPQLPNYFQSAPKMTTNRPC